MTTCIIAEKPSVARDIARIVGANTKQDGYLQGGGYLVTWAMGHLITLAMPEAYGYGAYKAEDLPIRPNPFQLIVRQVRKGKEYNDDSAALKQLKAIRHCFTEADRIIVATDAGREGELIFRYIYDYLQCSKPFDRLWISSLTDKAIREGLAQVKSGRDYDNLYHSAKARSEADWLVGINASRALLIARKGGYSLGRVQTPTLAMVCRRYLENKHFASAPYWRLNVTTDKDGISIKAVSADSFSDEAVAQHALSALRSAGKLSVVSVSSKTGTTAPPLLYDLTALQKEANRKHGFSADKTLSIAQTLYEKKATTYPRTGSRYISEDVFDEVPAILRALGEILPLPLNLHSVDNSKVTDHHAIIPTGESTDKLSTDESIIYQMIRTRFIEAFSPNSEEERMQVQLSDGSQSYSWRACRVLSLGWKAVAKEKVEEKEGDEEVQQLSMLPNLIEGDIKGFFNNIDHDIMIAILSERISDERFLRLIRKFLNAGYMEKWKFHNTFSGTPQGGIISPILANIYLDKLDKYMVEYISVFNKGKMRKRNPEYKRIASRKDKRVKKLKSETDEQKRSVIRNEIIELYREMQKYPATLDMDEDFRRMRYVRYADDFLIGVIGSKEECVKIKADIKDFLYKRLKLELSDEKTLITHGHDHAKFLGFEVTIRKSEKTRKGRNGMPKRSLDHKTVVLLPMEVMRKKLRDYGAMKIVIEDGKEKWESTSRPYLRSNDDLEILNRYNSEIRGIYNYYCIANNVNILNCFYQIMKESMYKTFSSKYNSTVRKIIHSYTRDKIFRVQWTDGKGKTHEREIYHGGFCRRKEARIDDADNLPSYRGMQNISLMDRLTACKCEYCGATDNLQMVHVRKLKDLKGKQSWERLMIARRRKTLAVCQSCYNKIHNGK